MNEKLARVQAYLAKFPAATKRATAVANEVGTSTLDKWQREGLITMVAHRPGGKQHNWMNKHPLGKLR